MKVRKVLLNRDITVKTGRWRCKKDTCLKEESGANLESISNKFYISYTHSGYIFKFPILYIFVFILNNYIFFHISNQEVYF